MKKPVFSTVCIPDRWQGHFDMLHDKCRNSAYARALRQLSSEYYATTSSCSESKNKINSSSIQNPLFCDIGTGSGLLACLVAKAFPSSHVLAFETVPELAKIARETVSRNDLIEQVTVWLLHTDVIDGAFMVEKFGRRADGVASELLDTGFFGEGLLSSLTNVNKNVLTATSLKNSFPCVRLSVPYAGKIFVQAWQSEMLRDMGSISDATVARFGLKDRSGAIGSCQGTRRGAALHMSGIVDNDPTARPVSPRLELMSLTFDAISEKDWNKHFEVWMEMNSFCGEAEVEDGKNVMLGQADALVLWWECDMTPNGAVTMDTVPFKSPSPDHWRQAVYFFNPSTAGFLREHPRANRILLECYQDRDEILMNVVGCSELGRIYQYAETTYECKERKGGCDDDGPSESGAALPCCSCGVHVVSSCFRLLEMNRTSYFDQLTSVWSPFVWQHLANSSNNNSARENNLAVFLGDTILAPASLVSVISMAGCSSSTSERNIFALALFLFTSQQALMAAKECLVAALETLDADAVVNLSENEFKVRLNSSVEIMLRLGVINIEFTEEDAAFDAVTEFVSWEKVAVSEIESLRKRFPDKFARITVLAEPYFVALQEEWTLHHWILSWQLSRALFDEIKLSLYCNTPVPTATTIGAVEVWASVFYGPSLWQSTCCPVGSVEGIDMSSINELLTHSNRYVLMDIDSCRSTKPTEENCSSLPLSSKGFSETISARCSQWKVLTPDIDTGATLLGCLDFDALVCGDSAVGIASIHDTIENKDIACVGKCSGMVPLVACQLTAEERLSATGDPLSPAYYSSCCHGPDGLIHGVVLWTRYSSQTSGTAIPTSTIFHQHPSHSPGAVQAVRCFEKPFCCYCCSSSNSQSSNKAPPSIFLTIFLLENGKLVVEDSL